MKQHPIDRFLANPPKILLIIILVSFPIAGFSYYYMMKLIFESVSIPFFYLVAVSHAMVWLGIGMFVDSERRKKT